MKRINSIDFAKGVAIIAVTLGHILGSFHIRDNFFIWVYSFELPLFFILSGVLNSIKGKSSSFKEYLCKQEKSIILPNLEFSVVYIFISFVFGLMKRTDVIRQFIIDCGYTFSGLGLGAIWFLPTFFCASVISFVISKNCKVGGQGLTLLIVVCSIASVLAWTSERYGYINNLSFADSPFRVFGWNILAMCARSIVGTSLIVIGQQLGRFYERYCHLIKRKSMALTLGIGLLIVGSGFGLLQGVFVDLHFAFIRNPILFYASAVCTTIGLVSIGTVVSSKVLTWLGQNSLYIMFCQIVQEYWCKAVNMVIDIGQYSNTIQYGIVIGSLVLVLLISTAITNFMLKFDYVNKWRSRKNV